MMLLDGGMGRQLAAIGAPFRQPEWSALALIEQPEAVAEVHRQYVAAGAQLVTTNCYALVPFHIGQERFDEQGVDLIRLAARLARSVADECDQSVLVAGSIPPLFGSYRPDLFDAEAAPAMFAKMIDNQRPFVDLFLAETYSSIEEITALQDACVREAKPLWISCSVEDKAVNQGVAELRSGESIISAVNSMMQHEKAPAAILFNCSQPEVMQQAISDAKSVVSNEIPLGVCANNFSPRKKEDAANEVVLNMRDDLNVERYCEFAKQWQESGATLIGGCCGIGPEYIKALAERFGD